MQFIRQTSLSVRIVLFIATTVLAVSVPLALFAGNSAPAHDLRFFLHTSLKPLAALDAAALPGESKTLVLGPASPDALYAVTVSIKDPAQIKSFSKSDSFLVTISDAQGEVLSKWLHAADLDLYLTLHARAAGPVTARISSASLAHLPALTTRFTKIAEASPSGVAGGIIAAQPNSTWNTAQKFALGQTIYGASDERPYAPGPAEDGYAAMLKGFQWFRFTFNEKQPRLVYFVLTVTDRDVPLDVDLFQAGKNSSGQDDVVPFTNGEFVYQIEATQNYPGLYKFRTRVLEPGHEYYIRVAANHPAFQLRTYEYGVPPYTVPQDAVRAGMDFLVNMGDSWLSNTPRRGSIALRTTMQHSETQLCIACHPSQFTERGYLAAVHNGYAPTQRPALEFISDRLYNNARPLYGEPGTNWVRMIYTARTVSSRLPLLADSFEKEITHDAPRPNFDIPYANFLKIHYKGVTTLPGDEADGCEPDVSPFEIAMQSWQTFDLVYTQTKFKDWLDERDHVESLAVAATPKNMIDLDWKIMMLSSIDKAKYAAQIDTLIHQLYDYENAAGGWPYQFDKKAKPADFISYNAVLALAMAGHHPETDAHLAVAVKAMLAAQRQEGSWEGDPVYQGFNTPFRATQFAVMALSTLYPGTTQAKNWDAAYAPPPATLAKNNTPLLLSQLDQFWDPAAPATVRQIRDVLEHDQQPLAREAAARALGHMADPGSVPTLIHGLSDSSKMVQIASAYALRMVLSRRQEVAPAGRKQLAAALSSPDARTRWGATRVFNQHFKELVTDAPLLTALEKELNDPVPYNRFQAASGIWRWYYWGIDQHQMRVDTLESLATRMNTETDPMVRRGIQESIYDLLDENTGYLSAWVRTAAQQEDKDKINNGYEDVVRDQAQVLAKVLRNGTPLGREGILNALWDFHIRHYALPELKADTVSIGLPAVLTKYVVGVPDLHRPGYEYPPYREAVDFKYDVHNGFFQTRIGNDSDLIHFFKSSGPELEEALLACLTNANDDMKMEVLKAGSTLSEAGTARFALAALNLSEDKSADVRQAVRYVYENGQRGVLNLNTPAPDPALVSKVTEILQHGNPDSQAVLLPLLAGLPDDSAWGQQKDVVAALRSLLEVKPHPANYAHVLDAAAAFPVLMHDPAIQQQVLADLHSFNRDIQRAALQVSLEHFINAPDMQPVTKKAYAELNAQALRLLIELASDPRFLHRHAGVAGGAISQDQGYLDKNAGQKVLNPLDNPIVFETILNAVSNRDANVSAAALDTLRNVKDVEKRKEFHAAMEQLQNSTNPRLKLIAGNVLQGKKLSEALKDVQPGSLLDFNYFVAKIEPILARPGPDGKACVFCHASHVIFKLAPPNAQGAFSPQDSKDNYTYAMRVVDVNNPTHSLMLIKPTRPTDSAGNVGDYLATHNGGQRWVGNESSPQYQTILEWVRGARLDNTQALNK